ncbi:hypothetical protein IMSAGC006_01622 [Muribaculaceae bacterium]|nr:hypothetical protein IMSAGC006_01622 [Muribaculaceae bacterium]
MVALSTDADSKTRALLVSSPPPPVLTGMSTLVNSSFFELKAPMWISVPSSFNCASRFWSVRRSISSSRWLITLFCTGLVEVDENDSSTSTSSIAILTTPSASGVTSSPLSLMPVMVPRPPVSLHALSWVHCESVEPVNCFVVYSPAPVLNVIQRPNSRKLVGTASAALTTS